MCGIAGLWTRTERLDLGPAAQRMGYALRHRGPDDGNEWWDNSNGIALAHRRLSIQDLSPGGRQPMISHSGRYVIVFNGEVYNFNELRKELPSFPWRGHSDTEVMLAAFDTWGIAQSIRRFIGMFAFALWDRDEAALYFVRDRVGIKPLYYGWIRETLVFASELDAIRKAPGFQGEIDRGALALFTQFGCIPPPYTIYQGIHKLAPATILKLDAPRHISQNETFWSARDVAESGTANPLPDDPDLAKGELESLLKDSVRLRMLSDVPVGAFLSGGIDSSVVAAIMQSLSSRPIKSFSIGFHEPAYNEADHAAAVAKCLATDHTELYVTSEEARSVVPDLPKIYDEPFADSSQIPTYLVSRLARRSVTVALSGDGGDELFGGYGRYDAIGKAWSAVHRFPRGARNLGAGMLEMLSRDTWETIFTCLKPLLPPTFQSRCPGDQVARFVSLLRSRSFSEVYQLSMSSWETPEIVDGAHRAYETAFSDARSAALSDPVSKMMYTDLISYLPDDILTKVDRASMANALEVRVPLLDHRLVEFAWRLPPALRRRNGKSKWLLREVLAKYVPRELFERPKMGFGVPIGEWLRGPLRDWAADLLDPKAIKQEGYFNASMVSQAWQDHQSRRENHQSRLWAILMFQAWRRHSVEVTTAEPEVMNVS